MQQNTKKRRLVDGRPVAATHYAAAFDDLGIGTDDLAIFFLRYIMRMRRIWLDLSRIYYSYRGRESEVQVVSRIHLLSLKH